MKGVRKAVRKVQRYFGAGRYNIEKHKRGARGTASIKTRIGRTSSSQRMDKLVEKHKRMLGVKAGLRKKHAKRRKTAWGAVGLGATAASFVPGVALYRRAKRKQRQ